MQHFPSVSVIVVNWNRKALLETCLTSLRERTRHLQFKVIVVDNGRSDGSSEMMKAKLPWVEIIRNKKNAGYPAANNRAIKHLLAKAFRYFLLLNNDTVVVDSNWMATMVKVAESNQKIGIVGCKLILPDGRVQQNPHNKTTDVDSVFGAAFLVKKEVVDKIGLFDEGFGLGYFEEIDYCLRARKAGFRVVYTPETFVIHRGAGSTTRENRQYIFRLKWKNYARLQLLNYSPKQMMNAFRWLIVRGDEMSFLGYELRRDWQNRLYSMLRGYIASMKEASDIFMKRRNRLARMWYGDHSR